MLWFQGGFTLRISGGATVAVDVPFGVIGRAPGRALVIDDPAASSRHAYLHLDHRGLFAVDLATRTGTRVGPGGGLSGWLRPAIGWRSPADPSRSSRSAWVSPSPSLYTGPRPARWRTPGMRPWPG